jgi:methionine synthase I (cobalamin-dependent)
MDEALRQLSDCWKGSMLAYAKTGLASDHDWAFDSIIGVEDYCNLVSHWVERFDLDMIGGCCGITPSHIDRLSDEFHSI